MVLNSTVKNYQDGIRGTHSNDVWYANAPFVWERRPQTLPTYITSLPNPKTRPSHWVVTTVEQANYMVCAACHGANGEAIKL